MQSVGQVVFLVALAASYWPACLASDQRFAPIFAERGTGVQATFEETQAAINAMWEEIKDVQIPEDIEVEDGMTPEVLEATKQRMGALVEVCQLDKSKCQKVFHQIEALKFEIGPQLINLVPYLETCFERQRLFCTQQ